MTTTTTNLSPEQRAQRIAEIEDKFDAIDVAYWKERHQLLATGVDGPEAQRVVKELNERYDARPEVKELDSELRNLAPDHYLLPENYELL